MILVVDPSDPLELRAANDFAARLARRSNKWSNSGQTLQSNSGQIAAKQRPNSGPTLQSNSGQTAVKQRSNSGQTLQSNSGQTAVK